MRFQAIEMIVTEMEIALGLITTLLVGIALGQIIRVKVYLKMPSKEKVKE